MKMQHKNKFEKMFVHEKFTPWVSLIITSKSSSRRIKFNKTSFKNYEKKLKA